jgi:hypothetical protein
LALSALLLFFRMIFRIILKWLSVGLTRNYS